MGVWLQGWAGDNAGPLVGRDPNRLLVAVTISDGQYPMALYEHGDLGGHPWFFDLYVTRGRALRAPWCPIGTLDPGPGTSRRTTMAASSWR